ncbi:hypothetical protein [Rhizobacter sp. P5_C2]
MTASFVAKNRVSKAAMTLRPIRTEVDYKAALKQVEPYFDDEPKPGSEAGAHFAALVTLIEAYEAMHFPMLGWVE